MKGFRLIDMPHGLSAKLTLAGALAIGTNLTPSLVTAQAEGISSAGSHTLPPSADGATRNSMAVGSDLYPISSTATNQPRFDRSSSLLVNTIGARTGLFGAASREGLTWANHYVPGTDQTGFVQLYSLSTSGHYGAFFGARSSDNHDSTIQNVIGSISLVVADGDIPHRHWATYEEGYIPAGASAYRLLINNENSIQNSASPAPIANPYAVNPDHLSNNLRLDCGIGEGVARSCTNPLSILNNGAMYRNGIIFGSGAIEERDGIADAIAMPARYALGWFAASGTPSWQIYSTASGASAGRLELDDGRLVVSVGPSATPALQIDKDAIATPAEITTGMPPAMAGTCPVHDQKGGQSAGAFSFSRDCSRGSIAIHFTVTPPNGWACSASDLTRGEAVLRQSGYTQTSATFDVTAARADDTTVFRCTGF